MFYCLCRQVVKLRERYFKQISNLTGPHKSDSTTYYRWIRSKRWYFVCICLEKLSYIYLSYCPVVVPTLILALVKRTRGLGWRWRRRSPWSRSSSTWRFRRGTGWSRSCACRSWAPCFDGWSRNTSPSSWEAIQLKNLPWVLASKITLLVLARDSFNNKMFKNG